jgi:hypothetical protein
MQNLITYKELEAVPTRMNYTNYSVPQKDLLLGLEGDDDLDLAKSTRSLKSASSFLACLGGVDGLRERLWV